VLFRFAYLAASNTFAVLRLLPMSDREKDAEILALRHQVRILQRQLGGQRVRFAPADRALLAALLGTLPRGTLRRLQLVVSPDRPHRSLDQDAPLQPAPEPITSRADIVDLNVRRRDRLGGILREYEHVA
jgi:hypothetical protein